ncbi:MAG: hypothetical protein LC650_05740, partial [Actinobacteria bacterium]|nr:hypothetical protein [Actinomycetota bacterium]
EDTAYTFQLFAATADGSVSTDASTINEDGETSAYYVVLAVDTNGTPLADQPTGDVDVSFTNGTASDLDYSPGAVNQTVAVGSVFSSTAIDDALADDGEAFTVALEGNYSAASDYESIVYNANTVVTTIVDNDTPPLADPVITDALEFVSGDSLPSGINTSNPVLYRSFTVNGEVDGTEVDDNPLTTPIVSEPVSGVQQPNLGGVDDQTATDDLVFRVESLPTYGELYFNGKNGDESFSAVTGPGTTNAEFTSSTEFYWVAGQSVLDLTTGTPTGVTAVQFDGSPGTVTITGSGAGVASTPAGQSQVPEQLGYRDGNTEALVVDFGGPTSEATVDISRLIKDEGEVGQVEAYRDGELVGRWTFTGDAGRTLYGEDIDFDIGGSNGSFTISGVVF